MKFTRALSQAAKAVEQKGAGGINAVAVNGYAGGSASISVAVRAGSRYEQSQGMGHFMTAARSTTSETHTRFLQQQQLGYAGATFTCENTRDHLVYTLTAGPKLIAELFNDVAIPAIFQNKYNQWECDELEPALKNQKASLSTTDKLIDGLHQASFKGGLGKSKYIPDHRLFKGYMEQAAKKANDYYLFYNPIPEIGERQRVQTEQVQAHRDQFFQTGNVSVFTSGISEAESNMAVANLVHSCPAGGKAAAPVSTFVSGEVRIAGKGQATGFVGFPAAPAGSADAAGFKVLAAATGGSYHSYESAGLFALPTGADVKGSIAAMTKLSNIEIECAIEEATVAHNFEAATVSGAVSQALSGSSNADFKKVTVSSVKSLTASLAKGPKSLAISGNLDGVPFVSEL